MKLINGPILAPHPTNRDLLYFVFGTHIFRYGTDVFRYDAASRSLTMQHNDQHDVNAIALLPQGRQRDVPRTGRDRVMRDKRGER